MSRDLLGRSLQERPDLSDLAAQGIILQDSREDEEGGEQQEEGGERIGEEEEEEEVYEEVSDDDLDPHVQRSRIALALKGVATLMRRGLITQQERSTLKHLILNVADERIVAGVKVYELDQNVEELLDTLLHVAKYPEEDEDEDEQVEGE